MAQILIIIPTYNEVQNIAPLVTRLAAVPAEFDVLFVDDDSPDSTAHAVTSVAEKYKWISLMKRSGKTGIASAYRDGFEYAVMKGYTTIIQMDADLSHDPQDIPEMLAALEKSDIVIGSRYVRGGGLSNWEYKRIFLSALANMFTRFLLYARVYDWTSGYKCFRATVLEMIDYSSLKSKGYAFQIEMIHRCLMRRLSVTEVPIIFHGRVHEHSKMSFSIVLEAFLRVLSMAVAQISARLFNR